MPLVRVIAEQLLPPSLSLPPNQSAHVLAGDLLGCRLLPSIRLLVINHASVCLSV